MCRSRRDSVFFVLAIVVAGGCGDQVNQPPNRQVRQQSNPVEHYLEGEPKAVVEVEKETFLVDNIPRIYQDASLNRRHEKWDVLRERGYSFATNPSAAKIILEISPYPKNIPVMRLVDVDSACVLWWFQPGHIYDAYNDSTNYYNDWHDGMVHLKRGKNEALFATDSRVAKKCELIQCRPDIAEATSRVFVTFGDSDDRFTPCLKHFLGAVYLAQLDLATNEERAELVVRVKWNSEDHGEYEFVTTEKTGLQSPVTGGPTVKGVKVTAAIQIISGRTGAVLASLEETGTSGLQFAKGPFLSALYHWGEDFGSFIDSEGVLEERAGANRFAQALKQASLD